MAVGTLTFALLGIAIWFRYRSVAATVVGVVYAALQPALASGGYDTQLSVMSAAAVLKLAWFGVITWQLTRRPFLGEIALIDGTVATPIGFASTHGGRGWAVSAVYWIMMVISFVAAVVFLVDRFVPR